MTERPVDFTASDDPRTSSAPLALALELPVLGVATRFETNSRYVLDVVEESFGAWRHAPPADAGARALVRVAVHGGAEAADGGNAAVRHVGEPRGVLIARSEDSEGWADPARGTAAAYVSAALAERRAVFRDAFVEALTFALLAGERHPVHAAALVQTGRALLLLGPSGAGKSTLAYAAHAAGIAVMSDDQVWVQTAPRFRVWGRPGRFRLDAAAAERFPEFTRSSRWSAVDRKGKRLLEWTERNEACYAAEGARVCLLRRGSVAEAVRVAPDVVEAACVGDVAPGFDRFPERHARVAAALAAAGGWRLTVTGRAEDAVPHLRRMLAEP